MQTLRPDPTTTNDETRAAWNTNAPSGMSEWARVTIL